MSREMGTSAILGLISMCMLFGGAAGFMGGKWDAQAQIQRAQDVIERETEAGLATVKQAYAALENGGLHIKCRSITVVNEDNDQLARIEELKGNPGCGLLAIRSKQANADVVALDTVDGRGRIRTINDTKLVEN